MRFALQQWGIDWFGGESLRIAESLAYVVYSKEGSGLQRARVEPRRFHVEQTAITDVHGEGTRLALVERDEGGVKLIYTIQQYPQQPFLLVRLSVTNLSQRAIQLFELVLLEAERGKLFADDQSRGLNFFKVGWHSWAYSGMRKSLDRESHTLFSHLSRKQYTNPTTPLSRRQGEFTSEGWALLAGEREALVVGLVSMADQFGQVRACCRTGELSLRLVTQADGILLEPGETFDSEWGYLQVVSLPESDPAREYICAVKRQMNARTQLEPRLQWTHWYHFYQDISAQKFIANLEAIRAVRDQIPFQVVQLDDGYQTAWGEWTTTNRKFPDGLQNLAERIQSAGYTPGLWLAPFVVQPGSWVDREHPDWLLHDLKGKLANAGFFYQFFGRALDTTHPGVQEHLQSLAETLIQRWGYRLLKLDFCYAGALPGKRYDSHATRAQALRRGLGIFRAAASDDVFLLGCGCPFGPAIGLVDGMRISPDTAPNWEPWFDWAPWATRLLQWEPSPPALRNNLRNVLNLSCLHRRWWWNDPDCLLARDQDTRLTEEEVRSKVTLAGLSGGMLVDSDDLTRLPPERLELLSLLTPTLSSGGQPLDLLERDMPELYHVPVQGAAGGWQLVGLFNWQDCPASKRLCLSELGFKPGQAVYVFDFWSQRLWQTREAELVFPEIPPHGCRLIRLCTVKEEVPALVGDTLHVTQGLEIEGIQMEAGVVELQIMDLGHTVKGNMWLRLPGRPGIVMCNGEEVSITVEENHIYRLELTITMGCKTEVQIRINSMAEQPMGAG